MGDKDQGIYRKFHVTRVDGKPKHDSCRYFVLDLDHDLHAIPALKAYARSCKQNYPALAEDITKGLETGNWSM